MACESNEARSRGMLVGEIAGPVWRGQTVLRLCNQVLRRPAECLAVQTDVLSGLPRAVLQVSCVLDVAQ